MLDAYREPGWQSYFRQAMMIESGVCFVLPSMTHDTMQAIIYNRSARIHVANTTRILSTGLVTGTRTHSSLASKVAPLSHRQGFGVTAKNHHFRIELINNYILLSKKKSNLSGKQVSGRGNLFNIQLQVTMEEGPGYQTNLPF